MKPIFTIHAGEYLVASEIEKIFKNEIFIWLPSKDTGIDLLLTDKSNKKTVSIQVKFSKDFNTSGVKESFREEIKGTGWWLLDEQKIQKSIKANVDYWIFVLFSFQKKATDYIIISPTLLLELFKNLNRKDKIHCYITVGKDKAFETRGLTDEKRQELLEGINNDENRNITQYLNNWKPIEDLLQ